MGMLKRSNVFFPRHLEKSSCSQCPGIERSDLILRSFLSVLEHTRQTGEQMSVYSLARSSLIVQQLSELQQDWKSKAGDYSDLMRPLFFWEGSYLVHREVLEQINLFLITLVLNKNNWNIVVLLWSASSRCRVAEKTVVLFTFTYSFVTGDVMVFLLLFYLRKQ